MIRSCRRTTGVDHFSCRLLLMLSSEQRNGKDFGGERWLTARE